MKTALLTLTLIAAQVSFAATKNCPLSAAIGAAKDEYAAKNFGEQGAEKSAKYVRLTSTNKEQFFVKIDGTDGGNGIMSFAVYLEPGTCQPAGEPVLIKSN